MKRLVLAFVASLAVVGLGGVTSSTGSAARVATTAISGYQVMPGGTSTDPYTLQVHRSYNVAITFTHRGATVAQVVARAGQPVYFDLLLGQYGGHGAHGELQLVDTLTVGPYSN
jgi:hypothetical protein